MKALLLAFFALILSCQELPKEYRGEEGKKKMEKYGKQFVYGVVRLDEEVKDKVPDGDYFLILALRNPQEPQPIAVLRVKNPKFPYSFKITSKNKIREDKLIEGEVLLSARISRSPMAEVQKGDLVGAVLTRAGEREVEVLISQEVK